VKKFKINGEFEIKLPQHRIDAYKGGWEVKRLKHMSENIGKGDVVYYVGAECGEMPALCQMWGAEVALFEPSEHFWSVIKQIWEANNLDDPLFFWSGFASNQDKLRNRSTLWQNIAMEYDSSDNLGFRELHLEAENFPQIKLDSVSKNFKPPTALSIDVEGSEFEVLKGAESILEKFKPKIWLSLHPEFLFDQWGIYANDVRNFLKDRGYKEFLIDYPPHEAHFYYE